MKELINKYNVPAPRYTSYPTVPCWDAVKPGTETWMTSVKTAYNAADGLSLYIHLPFCESLCTYCGCNTRITKNHGVEMPYIEALLKEWRIYRDIIGPAPNIKEIHLGGGTPTFFKPGNLRFLLTGILNGCGVLPGASFSFEAHPVNTTYEHLQALADIGFTRLSLGIQDFDPRVQEIINRVQTVKQVETVTSQARALGYQSINYDLVYGLPLQTTGGLQRTLWKTMELRPDRIAFYSYAHVPWIKPGQRMFTEKDLPSVSQKQELHELGRSLLMNAGYREVGMDHFALPSDGLFLAEAAGALHRNFMGYTEHRTSLLLALGVSSIGDAGTAFAQNEKKLEDYLATIGKGELPIMKGHVLSSDDRIIRRQILNLMCKGETIWNVSDPDELRLCSQARSRLAPLVEDGLVTCTGNVIHVTADGKRFLRNICMMLDERLWNGAAAEQKFSRAG
ncbi:oxygen-independent coproporphyrinogen III oxidase [Hufsiella ginkgonis]|uniref:Coproporphyrinogen-III oxidase n=1 Tax=Hufsiella ginkgonis TaxID=2695274 RepID=A0A7K1Y0L3_9SPHI|nr:oxygen-independent coproporphyrinogen III oxidase [Hufsiella ginkgonis]MXV16742.1 oxygen-independent coproporphyrinogen III oxidase [Hufsiella ginkgonis]